MSRPRTIMNNYAQPAQIFAVVERYPLVRRHRVTRLYPSRREAEIGEKEKRSQDHQKQCYFSYLIGQMFMISDYQ
jgi:hypothetical protein